MQEDDLNGIHIVAFAEEEDPGMCSFKTPLLIPHKAKWFLFGLRIID